MSTEEIAAAYGEVHELRRKAQEKEDAIINQLVLDGQLSAMEAMLVKLPSFGSGLNMNEAFVMAAVAKTDGLNTTT